MKITSRSFLNVRQYAAKKKWSSTFPTSGKFASLFIELPPGAKPRVWLETHGPAEAAGAEMRKHLVQLGMMQDHRGAPKGNRNAAVGTRDPKTFEFKPEADSPARNLQKSLSILNANLSRVGARPIPEVGEYGGPVGETLDEANLRIADEVGLGAVARAKPVRGEVVKRSPTKGGKATVAEIKRKPRPMPKPKKKLIDAMKAHTKATKPKRSHHKKVA